MLAAAPRAKGVTGRAAKLAAAAMVLPLLREWHMTKPQIDPVRFVGMRLLADAAYGSGVLVQSARRRTLRVLSPQVRFPLPSKRGKTSES